MIKVPWYARSPSPMTLIFWGILALYGTIQFKPKTVREYLGAFGNAVFILGLIVLPFDALWCIFQGLRFAYLHPEGILILGLCLLRDIVGSVWCYSESFHHFGVKGRLQKKGLLKLLVFVPYFIIFFLVAPDPSWTDWTYAIRFDYGNQRIITSYLLGIPMKIVQAFIYVKLWKKTT